MEKIKGKYDSIGIRTRVDRVRVCHAWPATPWSHLLTIFSEKLLIVLIRLAY